MRYLSLPELEQINSLFSNIEPDDGSRIAGRIEAYSCKAAGADKKLLKRLGERFPTSQQGGAIVFGESHEDIGELFGSSPPTGDTSCGQHNFSLKLLYYLISTMNMIFPDYDFSELKPDAFQLYPQMATVISQVNTTLFNSGINKNVTSFGEFSRRLWERIDGAIGLTDSEAYSFVGQGVEMDEEEENPFWEQGCIWSFNYFFWNRKLKRILLFTCRSISIMRDSDTFLLDEQSRSSTPLPSAQ